MEFACDFVYVPKPLNKKDDQPIPANMMKHSALLPPINRMRPRIPPPPPPPPPPTSSPKNRSPPTCVNPPPKVIDQLERNKNEKKVMKLIPFYENAEFHQELLSKVTSNNGSTQQASLLKKTALLPPHMRPSSTINPPLVSHNNNNQELMYELPKEEPALPTRPCHLNFHNAPKGYSGGGRDVRVPTNTNVTPPSVPAVPPKPSLTSMPVYLEVLPSDNLPPSPSTSSTTSPRATSPNEKGSHNNGSLPGNPNVILVSLGKLLSEEKPSSIKGKPMCCSQCGSVLDADYDNLVEVCYFCQPVDMTNTHRVPVSRFTGYPDGLFLLNPDEKPGSADDAMLIFCIDISGSMSITSEVPKGGSTFYRSRLQFVQEAVVQCVQRLSIQQPDMRVGLITFNYKVTMHGSENHPSHSLTNTDLVDSNCLKKAAAIFPTPPPLSETKDYLEKQVTELSESGTTALGPAALLAIAMASRHSGSKVIICTDGKANTDLGNLEVEDDDARTLLSSTIFYQDLGDYAANHGVTVSVLSIEGTDCRLDELGRLADRTGGKVVIASPSCLHTEFEQIIKNRTIATHCSVTLLLPKSLHLRGERESSHKGIREVGNINPDSEITFQFGASVQETTVPPPASGSRVSIQLQIRYKKRNGQMMLKVLTVEREVTDDSLASLSSLSVAIIQLNSSQASAALAVRGRFLDARGEGELQKMLIEKAIENNRNAEDKETYQNWVKTMQPIYNNIFDLTRPQSVTSDTQSLTDAGAVLFYTMKNINRKSMKIKH
ncbi:circularly permutated Ras protein 1 [Gouania willdenowi]|uniref:Circularly permutated Ras protein 1-like n=1 Tax=Gouania willdenowi TaxID=441366 RepID=A0A8C5DZB3_GOUWI|nr:circularly permutated Ras protein 1-like [Gouania willdenowi]XP_028332838.1 circularly permutated Ras protein 1-like [Gouania willdenowi]